MRSNASSNCNKKNPVKITYCCLQTVLKAFKSTSLVVDIKKPFDSNSRQTLDDSQEIIIKNSMGEMKKKEHARVSGTVAATETKETE
ncbi:hypothetical protein CsSME_00004320 [Camellia sinensis var. sinensis]